MKPRYIKRIIKDDFPVEVRTWIDTLLYPLNSNIEQNNQILEKNISLPDNLAADVRSLQIVGSSLICGNISANSNLITDALYYQATIDGIQYGVQAGQAIAGLGIPPGTVVSLVQGTTITLSQNSSITQLGAKYLSGGFFPLRIAHTLTFKPTSVFISNVNDVQGNPTYISEGVTPQWRLDGRDIVIDNISGLQAGRTYNITFIIL